MKIFKAMVKVGILLFFFGVAKSFAYTVRLYDETNTKFVSEVDNQVETQKSYDPYDRDNEGLPLPISVNTLLYLAPKGEFIPGVSLVQQSRFNDNVFRCRTSARAEFYEIIRRYDQWSCSPVTVEAIEKLTVYVKAEKPIFAALVDGKVVSSANRESIISAHTLDGYVPVSDWKKRDVQKCRVTNNSISINIKDFENVSCL